MTRLALILALLAGPAVAEEHVLDATLCRADHPAQCVCMSLIVEGADAGGQAQLAGWIAANPGWVVKAIGQCTEKVAA